MAGKLPSRIRQFWQVTCGCLPSLHEKIIPNVWQTLYGKANSAGIPDGVDCSIQGMMYQTREQIYYHNLWSLSAQKIIERTSDLSFLLLWQWTICHGLSNIYYHDDNIPVVWTFYRSHTIVSPLAENRTLNQFLLRMNEILEILADCDTDLPAVVTQCNKKNANVPGATIH